MSSRPEALTPQSMRAVVYERYGSPEVLELADVERPTPDADEVLVEVRATVVTQGDRRLREADFPGFIQWFGRLATGLLGPRHSIPGTNFAGRIIAIGDEVTRFAVGDDVFGACMHGAYAECVCVDEESPIAAMPAGSGYDEAAGLAYSAGTAWNFLVDRAEIEPGEQVLVIGAAGGVGRSAVQIATHLGADVTAVCRGSDAEFVRNLGADRVIDYTSEDFTDCHSTWDVIFDTSGTAMFRDCRDVLENEGRFVTLLVSLRLIWAMLWTSVAGGRRALGGVALDSRERLERLGDLVADGAIDPTVDSHYPLDQMREAHRRLEEGHPNGSVVVTVSEPSAAE